MDAELMHHLGYDKGEPSGRGSGNSCNGQSRKQVQGPRSHRVGSIRCIVKWARRVKWKTAPSSWHWA